MTSHILQREAFSYSGHAQEDLQNTEQCQQFTINELETVYYKSQVLTITYHPREDMEYETLAEDIALLYVSNRFVRSRVFKGSAPILFQGYGQSVHYNDNSMTVISACS